MSTILCYRGRTVTASDLETIRALLKAHPEASRRAFSQRLCEHWDWRQPNGALRDMVCRSLLLVLHRAEHIRLPAVRHRPPNNAIARRRPMALGVDRTPLEGRLDALRPVELLAVRCIPLEGLFDHLIADAHYLGPMQGVGEQLKYLALSAGRPLACLGFTSAPRHLAPRDRFIGWSPEVRRAHGCTRTTEIPVSLFVLVCMGSLMLIKNNKIALMVNHIIIGLGMVLIGVSNFLFEASMISAPLWMILVGIGLYLGYIPFISIFFDRLIATFKYIGTVGFIMYVADSFGYLGSVVVLFYKEFGQANLSWLDFFISGGYIISVAGTLLILGSMLYFHLKHKQWAQQG